jgi:hypothetical protein
LALKVLLGHRDHRAPKVYRDLLGLKAHKEIKVYRVSQEQPEVQVLRGQLAQQDL